MIRLEELSKTFPARGGGQPVQALDKVSLHVRPGETFGIIGMSGAGKSTLLRCISLLEAPSSGRIFLAGEEATSLRGKALQELRKKTGVVFQGYNLLQQRDILGNVAFPLELAKQSPEQRRQRALELLDLVGLSDKAQAYPSQLSGGQCQRVAIARALATKPSVLLCDEPTSALDPFTTQSILELLQRINKELGVTILVITHELSVVRRLCGRVAVMNDGHIVEQGDTRQLLTNPQHPATKLLLETEGGLRYGLDS